MQNDPKPVFAPRADTLIHSAQHSVKHVAQPLTPATDKLVHELKKLKTQGEDGFRSLFIQAERGDISNFGDYEEYLQEGEVEHYEDFVELYESEYPDAVKWYTLSFSEYQNVYYIAIDGSLTIQANAADFQKDLQHSHDELCDWLYQKVNSTVKKLAENADEYNAYVENNLSYRKRYGKLLRSDYWSINQEEKDYFASDFADEDIKRFKKIAETSVLKTHKNKIKRMNAGDFFGFCKICYEANDYFSKQNKPLDAKEMYLNMADGRDCGLRSICTDSDAVFLQWHTNESHCGGHPWEICRGGNSTHISLYVHREANEWMIILAGSSRTRAVETIRMALALHKNNIPFNLRDADELYRMLTGQDFIGIVPEYVFPRYCHSSFPKEDRIIDFMNLYHEHEQKIINKAHWYPIDHVELE
jgi:hypothetical protein